MATLDFAELAARTPVMAILRNFPPAEAVMLANRAWDLGIEMVEVPIHRPEYLPSLEAVTAAGHERGKFVGAGTILDRGQIDTILSLGVDFAVAPGLDVDLATYSVERGIPFIPGVATPTEVQHAFAAGFTWIKAFPATSLGAAWFKAVHGPFPAVKLVATGGIDASNANEYLNAGASFVAVGSALEDPAQLDLLSEIIRSSNES